MVGRRGCGRGRKTARLQRVPVVNHGRFGTCPMDPPPAFKSGWEDIRLEEALGSTDVNVTTGNVRDALATLGITANAIKIMKISVWCTPGTAANATLPQVILSVSDPIGGGTLGTRTDTGQLSRAARLCYHFSDTVRESSIDLPGQGSAGVTFAKIATSQATGVFQLSISYNI